jgi:predicted amidohydrolase
MMKFAALLAAFVVAAGFSLAAETVGRPVRILSLSFVDQPLEKISAIIDAEAAKGVDLVILPETWRGQKDDTMEPLDGPTTKAMSALARKHHTYIVSPIDRLHEGHRLNTAVLIDREGKVAFTYDKVFPYWSEFNHKKKVEPSAAAPVYTTDFGKIGIAICFDANFPEVWKALADQGAELIVWPSAYSAGTTLQAHALTNHYYIVTSTWAKDCIVYDINGEEILYQRSKDINVTRVTLDLDRGIYHQNFNLGKRTKLLKERADDIREDRWMDREQWFVLSARRPGVSARALAHQYGMEELRDYINRSRREINKMRGKPFPWMTEPSRTQ